MTLPPPTTSTTPPEAPCTIYALNGASYAIASSPYHFNDASSDRYACYQDYAMAVEISSQATDAGNIVGTDMFKRNASGGWSEIGYQPSVNPCAFASVTGVPLVVVNQLGYDVQLLEQACG